MLTKAHGRITSEHVARVGKMAGPCGKLLDRQFTENIGETYLASGKKKQDEQDQRVIDFVRIYKPHKLVTYEGLYPQCPF